MRLILAVLVLSFAARAEHWSYTGEHGPAHWGETCSVGTQQSPIDLRPGEAHGVATEPISFAWKASHGEIVNNGHTVQVNVDPGSALTVQGVTYALVQFHFHTPSEHTVSGKASPMEVHFVHKTAEGKLGVVGVLIEEGASNAVLAEVFAKLPAQEGKGPSVSADLAAVLPSSHAYYGYAGSLTTPPCSEGVRWMVLASPIEASKEQIAAFRKAFAGNSRPARVAGAREVVFEK